LKSCPNMSLNGLCGFPGCRELPILDYDECTVCKRPLCPKHVFDASIDHRCPSFYPVRQTRVLPNPCRRRLGVTRPSGCMPAFIMLRYVSALNTSS
jgi:hypothetical protein